MQIIIEGIEASFKEALYQIKKEADAALTVVATKIVQELRDETPVDTGRARDGWTQEESHDGVVISNDVPYIESLNNGHSKQAPSFFVEKTLLRHGTPSGNAISTPE